MWPTPTQVEAVGERKQKVQLEREYHKVVVQHAIQAWTADAHTPRMKVITISQVLQHMLTTASERQLMESRCAAELMDGNAKLKLKLRRLQDEEEQKIKEVRSCWPNPHLYVENCRLANTI
jgi:hypothetical protein